MTRYLVDTNVLLRAAVPSSAHFAAASGAIAKLWGQGDELYLGAQVLIEFWVVASRPVEANGLGWPVEQVLDEITRLLDQFLLLPDGAEVLDEWLRLVAWRRPIGKRAHDAHLVALMNTQQVGHLLTFNIRDFNGYGITAVSPEDVGPAG